MTTFTKAEIRGAILRAADRIEALPSSYRFMALGLPDGDGCGTPHCMIGWIGHELGMTGYVFNVTAKTDISELQLYSSCQVGYTKEASKAVARMRAYADRYFPAEVAEPSTPALEPSYLTFRQRFEREMAAA